MAQGTGPHVDAGGLRGFRLGRERISIAFDAIPF